MHYTQSQLRSAALNNSLSDRPAHTPHTHTQHSGIIIMLPPPPKPFPVLYGPMCPHGGQALFLRGSQQNLPIRRQISRLFLCTLAFGPRPELKGLQADLLGGGLAERILSQGKKNKNG